MPAGNAKNWCFTLNADEKKGEHLTWRVAKECPLDWWARSEQTGLLYMVVQVEAAPTTGKVHCQGYIALKERTSLPTLKKLFSPGAHWEVARGTPKENYEYCTKEHGLAGPWEMGKRPDGKGTRSDLKGVYAMVKAEKTNAEILEATEGKAAKFEKAVNFMRATLNEKASDRQLQGVNVVVLYGPTGTGKTYAAVNHFGKDDYHIQDCPATPNSKLWFDGYAGQRVLILDDFSGDFCNYRYLLRVLDKYRLKVEIKGSHVWALWTTVVITTNVHPSGWYGAATNSAPLRRRINEIRYCEEQGLYQYMDWDQHIIGDHIAFGAPPTAPPAPVASTSDAPTPVMAPADYDASIILETQIESPVPRKRLRRQATVPLDTDKGKEKEKEKEKDNDADDELTDPDAK